MDQIDIGTWINLLTTISSVGIFAGITITRLNNLEKKQDKHNQLIERVFYLENSTKSAHKRIDDIPKHLHSEMANQINQAMKDFCKEHNLYQGGND